VMEKKKVLLIEDNRDDEALAVRALQKTNIPIEVVVARDGQEALDYLFSPEREMVPDQPDLPDLVLLDLKLPKIDGVTVLTKLRAHPKTKYLTVVILTSSREESDLVRCYDAGANSYIRKPLDFTEFSDTARQLCSYWLSLNERPGRS
jgi:two-component system response regulator